MKATTFLGVVLVALVAFAASQSNPLSSARQKALTLLPKLSEAQKFSHVHGQKKHEYVGQVVGIPSLGIPPLHLQDGPQGVGDKLKGVTAWPSALAVVASFDRAVMHHFGRAMAEEQRAKGTNVLLGPMMNIARIPTGGRNFESFGEDPFLAAEMAVANILGIQSVPGMMACAKHWVNNNQELNRTLTSADVDQRTQHEIYFRHFEASVNAGVASFMCSYNKINDTYACENDYTLKTILKGEMGFQGFVMSDWGATHSTVNSANNGLDMEMPGDDYFGDALEQAVSSGKVAMSRVDDMVLRILTAMYYVNLIGSQPVGNISAPVTSAKHAALARSISEQSTVLIKNDIPKNGKKPLLPLDVANIKTVAIIGDDGKIAPVCVGWGSGRVIPPYCVSPYDGLFKAIGSHVDFLYAPDGDMKQAQEIAAQADVAIVFESAFSTEGRDRPSLSLGLEPNALIDAVAAANPKTVVVLHCPSACLLPFWDAVPSIVQAWYPGQENGNAIADILLGVANPSVTWPMSDEQVPARSTAQYPGVDNEAEYSEDLLVGYRWYSTTGNTPRVPFGHGLSYTTFAYSNLAVSCSQCSATSNITVTFTVANNGGVLGSEVPQLYIGYPKQAGEPLIQLAGFDKVSLSPQATHTFTFTVVPRSFSVWDIATNSWAVVPGQYSLSVGASSEDLRLTTTVTIMY